MCTRDVRRSLSGATNAVRARCVVVFIVVERCARMRSPPPPHLGGPRVWCPWTEASDEGRRTKDEGARDGARVMAHRAWVTVMVGLNFFYRDTMNISYSPPRRARRRGDEANAPRDSARTDAQFSNDDRSCRSLFCQRISALALLFVLCDHLRPPWPFYSSCVAPYQPF